MNLPSCVKGKPCTPEGHVAAGAAYLDEYQPGWERRIDLSILDIENAGTCVCGQVVKVDDGVSRCYGFITASQHLWTLYATEAVHFGFARRQDQDAWVALIKERFSSGQLSDGK